MVAAAVLLALTPRRAPALHFVRVPGGVSSITMDATGGLAYLTAQGSVTVVDVRSRQLLRRYPISAVDHAGALDSSGTLLPVYGFSAAGVLDLTSGSQRVLLQPVGLTGVYVGAAVASGALYVPSLQARVIYRVPLSGAFPSTINPYPDATEQSGGVAGPCTVTASADGTKILAGDEFHRAVHLISTADGRVIGTFSVGTIPCRLFFLDARTAIAVSAGAVDTDGSVALVDLATPFGVPQVIPVRGFHNAVAAATDAARTAVVLLATLRRRGPPLEGFAQTAPRLAVVDLGKRKVRGRAVLPRRGSGTDVALTPDGETVLVGTTRGVWLVPRPRR